MEMRVTKPSAIQSTAIYRTNNRTSTSSPILNYRGNNASNDALARQNIRSDIENGRLVHQPAIELFGMTLRKGYYLYHPTKTETWGDLKARYNIPDGVLRKANGLRFEACTMDGRGDCLNAYEINYFKRNGAKIPEQYIKKYVH